MRAGQFIIAFAAAIVGGTAYAEGDAARGEKQFAECAACHSLEPGVHGVGPSLHGVFNRTAGAFADYRYSPALKRSGIIWNADTLDAFIAGCQHFIPGNRMPYDSMPDAADRADLIAYLQKATR
jgi:cytochrome c